MPPRRTRGGWVRVQPSSRSETMRYCLRHMPCSQAALSVLLPALTHSTTSASLCRCRAMLPLSLLSDPSLSLSPLPPPRGLATLPLLRRYPELFQSCRPRRSLWHLPVSSSLVRILRASLSLPPNLPSAGSSVRRTLITADARPQPAQRRLARSYSSRSVPHCLRCSLSCPPHRISHCAAHV